MALINTLIGVNGCQIGQSVDTQFCPAIEQKYMQTHVAYRMRYLMAEDSNGNMRTVWPGVPYEAQEKGWTLFRNDEWYNNSPLVIGSVSYNGGTETYTSDVGPTTWRTNYSGNVVVMGIKSLYPIGQIDYENRNPIAKMIITEDNDYPSGVSKLLDRANWISTKTSNSVGDYGDGHLIGAPQGLMLWGSFPNIAIGGGVLLKSSHVLNHPYVELKFNYKQNSATEFTAEEITKTPLKLVATDTDNGCYYYYGDCGVFYDFTTHVLNENAYLVYVAFPNVYFDIPSISDMPTFNVIMVDNFLKIR